MTKDNDEQSGEIRGNVAKTMLYKVAKTMLFRKPQASQDVPPVKAQQSAAVPPQVPGDKPKTKVAKTQLDHRMIMNVQSQFGERKNERLQQEIANRQLEPVKEIEPIKAQKKVTSCPFSWTEDSANARFKHCPNCQKAIYKLEGMEFDQAEALILKRENRDKFTLYERPDGKFMTSDCPVAQKKRFQIMGVAAFVCVCIVAAVAAFVLMPPSAPTTDPTASSTSDPTAGASNDPTETPPAAPAEAGASTSASSTGNSGASPSSTSGGVHHYEAGDPVPVVPSPQPTKIKQPEKTFSEQEQKGDFWQFPNGQPADDFSRTQTTPSGQ